MNLKKNIRFKMLEQVKSKCTDYVTQIDDLSEGNNEFDDGESDCLTSDNVPENPLEECLRILHLYSFTRSKRFENILGKIIQDNSWNLDSEMLFSLCRNISAESSIGYVFLANIADRISKTLAIPSRYEIAYVLMEHEPVFGKALQILSDCTNDPSIEPEYRIKRILSSRIPDVCKPTVFQMYIDNKLNACSHILMVIQHAIKLSVDKDRYFNRLKEIADDVELDDRIRADAADVMYINGDDSMKSHATDILAKIRGNAVHVYDDSENAHSAHIRECAEKTILYLRKECEQKCLATHKEIKYELLRYASNDGAALKSALRRIKYDLCKFTRYDLYLRDILQYIYDYCISSMNKDELLGRLVEELVDASGMCATGYAHRMANVLSGFTEHGIGISFEDELKCKFAIQLTKYISSLPDCDKILDEMTLPSSSFWARGAFLKVLREKYLSIRDLLYLEYREYMSDTDFDLYMRKALIAFEGDI